MSLSSSCVGAHYSSKVHQPENQSVPVQSLHEELFKLVSPVIWCYGYATRAEYWQEYGDKFSIIIQGLRFNIL